MVEVYGKKARQINAQDPAHRPAYTWVNAQCKERKESSGGKERKKKKTSSPREGIRTHNPHLRRQGSRVCIATFALQKDPGFSCFINTMKDSSILNSIAQYPLHMMERERESVIELNLKVQ